MPGYNSFNHQDPRIDYDRQNDGPQETEADHLRYEIARVTDWAARFGGHPEQAPVYERELCAVAGLPQPPPERDDRTPDLFAAIAA